MTLQPTYRRVMIKLSGDTLCAEGRGGLAPASLAAVAGEIAGLARLGVQVGLVVGGGNFLRGRDLAGEKDIRQTTADAMGMLATIMNALALQDKLNAGGTPAVVFSAIAMPSICQTFNPRSAREALDAGKVALFAGGTGCPYFTTDTCAALRAAEVAAEVLLKATKVDGVYDRDPMKYPEARKFDRLTYQEALARQLGVMDMTAFSLCMESRIPIIVLQLFKDNSLVRAVCGQSVGTVVAP